jgi:hypothetical protein
MAENPVFLAFAFLLMASWLVWKVYRYWNFGRDTQRELEMRRRVETGDLPPNPRDYHYVLTFDSIGFTRTDLRKHEAAGMRWSEVCRAVAFKRDLITVDDIRLLIERADGSGLCLNEDMARWESLMEALPQFLPGCTPWSEWFPLVAFPAFATNETEIYNRSRGPVAIAFRE